MQVKWVDFHTHQVSDNDNVSLFNWMIDENLPFTAKYCTAGIHPWYIVPEHLDEWFALLEERVKLPSVLAVGECGLDKLRGPSVDMQEIVLMYHVELSEKYQKPLILHCVKGYSELLDLRKRLKPLQPWVFHGFSASKEVMFQAEKDGFYFSFGISSLILGTKANDALRHVSLNRLFLETDERLIGVEELYLQVAEIRQIPIEVLRERILNNFLSIFKID
jgi:TatD DNase family protein